MSRSGTDVGGDTLVARETAANISGPDKLSSSFLFLGQEVFSQCHTFLVSPGGLQ